MKNILASLSTLITAKADNLIANTTLGKTTAEANARAELSRLNANLQIARDFQTFAYAKEKWSAEQVNIAIQNQISASNVRRDADAILQKARQELTNFGH